MNHELFPCQVVDTPDLAMLETDMEKKRQQISIWKRMTSPGPTAILLTVRCDVSFNQSDCDAFSELKELWGDHNAFCRRLLVVFTFSDKNPTFNKEAPVEDMPKLKEILSQDEDVRTTHILVNNTATSKANQRVVKELLFIVNAVGKCVGYIHILTIFTHIVQLLKVQQCDFVYELAFVTHF